MVDCCKNTLQVFNFIVLIIGLGLLGIGIYIIVEFNNNAEDAYGQDWPEWTIYVPIVIGALVSFWGSLACCLTAFENRCLLGTYGFFMLISAILIIAVGSGLIVYTDYMEEISSTPVTQLDGGLGDTRRYLSDFTTGVYNKCCQVGGATLNPQPTEEDQFIATNGDALYDYGFYDLDSYELGNSTIEEACTPQLAGGDLGFCPVSTSPNISNGIGLKSYQRASSDYARDNLFPSGIALIVFGCILFLVCIMSCHLACRSDADTEKKQRKQSNTRSGAETAGTGAGAPSSKGITMT